MDAVNRWYVALITFGLALASTGGAATAQDIDEGTSALLRRALDIRLGRGVVVLPSRFPDIGDRVLDEAPQLVLSEKLQSEIFHWGENVVTLINRHLNREEGPLVVDNVELRVYESDLLRLFGQRPHEHVHHFGNGPLLLPRTPIRYLLHWNSEPNSVPHRDLGYLNFATTLPLRGTSHASAPPPTTYFDLAGRLEAREVRNASRQLTQTTPGDTVVWTAALRADRSRAAGGDVRPTVHAAPRMGTSRVFLRYSLRPGHR